MLSQLRWTGPSLEISTNSNGLPLLKTATSFPRYCALPPLEKISISLPKRCVPEIETLLDITVVIDIFLPVRPSCSRGGGLFSMNIWNSCLASCSSRTLVRRFAATRQLDSAIPISTALKAMYTRRKFCTSAVLKYWKIPNQLHAAMSEQNAWIEFQRINVDDFKSLIPEARTQKLCKSHILFDRQNMRSFFQKKPGQRA